MAYNGTNPVSVGDKTLKSQYDRVFDNTVANNARLDAMDLTAQRLWLFAAAARMDHIQTISTTADARCMALYGQYGVIGTTGPTDTIFRTSNYGRSWILDTSLDPIMEQVCGLAFNSDGSVLVAVGITGGGTHEIAYSTNQGDTWTGAVNAANSMISVCWSGSLFVAVGTAGLIYTSSNGTAWTSRTAAGTPSNINFSGVCWSSALSLFIAVGNDSTGAAHIEIQTSADGTTWAAQTAAATAEAVLYAVTEVDFGSSTYVVAVGPNTEIQYSANGTSWTSHPQSGISSVTIENIAAIPTGAIMGANNVLQYQILTSITRVSSGRYPEDDVAPAATAGRLTVGYSDEFGIVAAGTNGTIWQSYPPKYTSL